jgi:hypothetical protein
VERRIWVDPRGLGGTRRTGEILEVLGSPEHPRYRIRWADGHESIIAPGSDASLPHPRPPSRARATAARTPAAGTQEHPPRLSAAPGDRLVVRPHRLGEPERDAEILQAHGRDGAPPFTVRWSDTGRTSRFFPGADASVEHLARPARARARRTRSRRPAVG